MIPLLLFLLLFLAPGNDLIYALVLMFHREKMDLKLSIHHYLFIAWLAWAFVCCCFSSQVFVALMGNILRMEGFVFWLILARLGYIFWTDYGRMSGFRVPVLWVCGVFLFFSMLNEKSPASEIMVSGFGSVAFAILSVGNPVISIIPLSAALSMGTRTVLIVVAAVLAFLCYGKIIRNIRISIMVAVACAIISFGIHCFKSYKIDSEQSSVVTKVMNFKFSSIGYGARTSWIVQTYGVMADWPWYRKIMGNGLDTIIYSIGNPADGFMRSSGAPDRTHNVVCDIMLQTGLVGLLLSMTCFWRCAYLAFKFPITRNRMCFAGILAWAVFGFFNPQGCTAHALMVICVFGMRDRR